MNKLRGECDFREKVGPESGRKVLSLLSQHMEVYRRSLLYTLMCCDNRERSFPLPNPLSIFPEITYRGTYFS